MTSSDLAKYSTRRALGRAHLPPTKVIRCLSLYDIGENNLRGPRNNICYSGHVKYFSDWLIDWLNLVPGSGLWSRSGSKVNQFFHVRHLSTGNMSSKSIHAFLSNLANRQTERQTNKHGQKHVPPPLSEVMTRSVARYLLSKCRVHTTGCRRQRLAWPWNRG